MASLTTPPDYRCPISYEIMEDPVICVDGNSYERRAIEEWFKNHNTSPLTGLVLSSIDLIPNRTLKRAIFQFQQQSEQESSVELQSQPKPSESPIKEVEKRVRQHDGRRVIDTYKGEVIYKKGREKFHGLGELTCRYEEESELFRHYKGNFRNGKKHGHGQWFYYPNNNKYEGNWKNGQKHGHGLFIFSNGDVYDGNWVNGRLYGDGIMKSQEGVYNVSFNKGKAHGRCQFTSHTGYIYEVFFRYGKLYDGRLVFRDNNKCRNIYVNANMSFCGMDTCKNTTEDLEKIRYQLKKWQKDLVSEFTP